MTCGYWQFPFTPDFVGQQSYSRRDPCTPGRIRTLNLLGLDALDQAEIMDDLRVPPCNGPEALRGDRQSQHSVRIDDQYRICFRWTEMGSGRG
ncbi:MAG: type II toxin-antitoxin system RelE/ParE family toxin [bacterium]